MVEAGNFYGKFEFQAFGTRMASHGHALRRVLLSSLEGYAISSIKIDGVKRVIPSPSQGGCDQHNPQPQERST